MKHKILATVVVLCLLSTSARLILYNLKYFSSTSPIESLANSAILDNPSYPASKAILFLNERVDGNVLVQRQSDFINYSKRNWLYSFDNRFIEFLNQISVNTSLNWLERNEIKYIVTNYYFDPTFAKSFIYEIITNPHLSKPLFDPSDNDNRNSSGQVDQVYLIGKRNFSSENCESRRVDKPAYLEIRQPIILRIIGLLLPNSYYNRIVSINSREIEGGLYARFLKPKYLARIDLDKFTNAKDYVGPTMNVSKASYTIEIHAKAHGLFSILAAIKSDNVSLRKFVVLNQTTDKDGNLSLKTQIPPFQEGTKLNFYIANSQFKNIKLRDLRIIFCKFAKEN